MKKNPFRFGKLVTGKDFCNREEELKQVKTAISNNYSFWIYSPRRFGKTSLLLKAFQQLPQVKTVYIDLYNINSLAAFAEKYAGAVLGGVFDWKSGIKDIGQKLSGLFKRISPKISFDMQGVPSFSFESQEVEDKLDLENILDIPERIAAYPSTRILLIPSSTNQGVTLISPSILRP